MNWEDFPAHRPVHKYYGPVLLLMLVSFTIITIVLPVCSYSLLVGAILASLIVTPADASCLQAIISFSDIERGCGSLS